MRLRLNRGGRVHFAVDRALLERPLISASGRRRLDGPIRALRRALASLRNAVLFAVPHRLRGRLVASLPHRVVPPEMRRDFFDRLYDSDEDPFGFDRSSEEQLKFRRTLELCGDGELGRVLEIGCAVGSFTELIAPRSAEVLAIDVSATAVERAVERLREQSHVRFETKILPEEFPEEQFDLVVASDVLYYLRVDEVLASLRLIEAALALGGAFVAVHYVPRMGSVLDGDEVHDLLSEHTTLAHAVRERAEFGAGRTYRLDRYEKV